MMKNSKYCIFAFGVLLSASSFGETTSVSNNQMIDLNNKKSWCIGRYAVDLLAKASFYEQINKYDEEGEGHFYYAHKIPDAPRRWV